MAKNTPATQWPMVTPAKIAFIGDGPGHEELRANLPFVGPAGRVLNYIMRAANLERDNYYVGTVFDKVAPNGDFSPFLNDKTTAEGALDRLEKELRQVQPNVIVPLGGTALWAFTGERKVAVHRGAVLKATRRMAGSKLLPTFEPQAVQRDWRLLSLVVGDFIRAAQEADRGPEIVYPKRTLLIDPTLQDVEDFCELCLQADKLSIDIETGWNTITMIAIAPRPDLSMCVPFLDMRKPNKSYWPDAETELKVWKAVKRVCECPVPKIGQNYTYDLSWLWKKHGIATRNYRFDTRLQHKTMFPELPADLASMSATYTRIGSYKSWGGHYNNEVEKKDG